MAGCGVVFKDFFRILWWSRWALSRRTNSSAPVLGEMMSFASSEWSGCSIQVSSSSIKDQFALWMPAEATSCEEVWDNVAEMTRLTRPIDIYVHENLSWICVVFWTNFYMYQGATVPVLWIATSLPKYELLHYALLCQLNVLYIFANSWLQLLINFVASCVLLTSYIKPANS